MKPILLIIAVLETLVYSYQAFRYVQWFQKQDDSTARRNLIMTWTLLIALCLINMLLLIVALAAGMLDPPKGSQPTAQKKLIKNTVIGFIIGSLIEAAIYFYWRKVTV